MAQSWLKSVTKVMSWIQSYSKSRVCVRQQSSKVIKKELEENQGWWNMASQQLQGMSVTALSSTFITNKHL